MGKPDCDFWLGNDKNHWITSQGVYKLRVEFCLKSDINASNVCTHSRVAEYDGFVIGNVASNYRLSLDDYISPPYDMSSHILPYSYAPNSLIFSGDDNVTNEESIDNMEFSAYDNDNDMSDGNCAEDNQGGWWYNNCGAAALNGPLLNKSTASPPYLTWRYNYTDISLGSVMLSLQPINELGFL